MENFTASPCISRRGRASISMASWLAVSQSVSHICRWSIYLLLLQLLGTLERGEASGTTHLKHPTNKYSFRIHSLPFQPSVSIVITLPIRFAGPVLIQFEYVIREITHRTHPDWQWTNCWEKTKIELNSSTGRLDFKRQWWRCWKSRFRFKWFFWDALNSTFGICDPF